MGSAEHSTELVPGEEPKTNLRPIEAIHIPGDIEPVGELPELKWIPIDLLVVNADYQRDLSGRSRSVIRRVATKFTWGRVKALSVTPIDGGRYEVIDGQHTAIAALSRGDIKEMPCMVSDAKDVAGRAADFVGINKDRVAMTALQVFWGKVAAGDELAIEVLQGIERAGARILKGPPGNAVFEPGDIMSISTFLRLAEQGGPIWVRRVAEIGVKAGLMPIKAPIVKAVASLLWDNDIHGLKLNDTQLLSVLTWNDQDDLITQARINKKRDGHGSPTYHLARRIHQLAPPANQKELT